MRRLPLRSLAAVAWLILPAVAGAQAPGALPGPGSGHPNGEDIRRTLARLDSLLALPAPPKAAFLEAGALWIGAGRPDSAATLLRRGVKRHPASPELLALLGHAHGEAGEWRRAAESYREASAWVEDPAWLDLRRASAESATGDTVGALSTLRALPRVGTDPVAVVLAARSAERMGRSDQAVALLLEAEDAWPGAAFLAEEASRIGGTPSLDALAEAGSPWALRRVLDAAPGPESSASSDRDRLRVALRNGIRRVAAGESALVSGRMTLEPTPETLISGHDLRSRWVLERLASDREDLDALLATAVLDRPWGGEELDLLRRGYPGSALLEEYRARLSLRSGDARGAERTLLRLLSHRPDDPHLHELRGETLEALRDTAGALRSYGIALELDPGDGAAFDALVRLHGTRGSLEHLLERVRRLRLLAPGDPARWEREMELLHRMGRLEEARALASERPGGEGRG